MHCSDAPWHGGVPGRLLSTRPMKAWSCTTRTCASAAATASTPARSGAAVPAGRCLRLRARWTSARSAPAVRRRTSRGGVQEVRPHRLAEGKAAGGAPRCAPPRPSWAATPTWWPTSTASASWRRGKGAEVWGWATAYGKPEQKAAPQPGAARLDRIAPMRWLPLNCSFVPRLGVELAFVHAGS